MACLFKQYKDELFQEFEEYYEKMPYDVSKQQKIMDEWLSEISSEYSYEKKALVYKGAAELCDVHVFRTSPFFFELVSGRMRNTSQNGYPPGPGLEGWFIRKNDHIMEEFQEWMKPFQDRDLVWGEVFTDMAHHTMGYEKVLRVGISGIEEEVRNKLDQESDDRKISFYHGALTMCAALKQIAENFAAKAEEMLKDEKNPDFAENLREIVHAAKNVPYKPASSFYEALCVILFMKEIAIDLEGVAVAVLGHLDRILLPYYEKDISSGKITYESAKNYMAHWLSHTDARWDLENCDFASTNCSITIGGCDEKGRLIWNDISKMILECYDEFGFVNPKVQARMTVNHPDEYFDMCSAMVAKGQNIFSFLNDDIIIKANVKMGKLLEDSRLYSAGGCQEPVLDNKEFNSRAFLYISLPQMVNTFLDSKLNDFMIRSCNTDSRRLDWESFEELYEDFIGRLKTLYKGLVQKVNQYEKKAALYNPCAMISATLDDCIEKGKDMTEGGAVYNSTSIPMVGIGTAINSLLAVKTMVYGRKMLTLKEFSDILSKNYVDSQRIQDYIKNRCPQFGDGSEESEEFSQRFFADAAAVTSHYDNARGGKYEASLFVFYLFDWMKDNLGATPDGREAGAALSRGINPTEQSGITNIANILSTISKIDLSLYPGSGVTYLEMPVSKSSIDKDYLNMTVKAFLRAGGSALDINMLDVSKLEKAKKDPEQYKNIIVRVCGFSAYFTSLAPEIQDEIIGRTIVNG